MQKLAWDTFWNSGPGSVFADRRGVVSLLELREAADVDGVRVGDARPGSAVGHEPVRDVGHDTRS